MGILLTQRLVNLDYARGIAALVVVLFHATIYSGSLMGETAGFADFIALSPFGWILSGGGAVMVFFVLSGFVLDRATHQGLAPTPSKWVAGRLLRLYLPIYPALFVAFILRATDGSGIESHVLWGNLGLDSTLILGHGDVLGVLWSLRWEIIYSLLLPLIVSRFQRATKSIAVHHIAGAVLVSGLGNAVNIGFVQYLPMIFAGFLLSRYVVSVEARSQEGGRSQELRWTLRSFGLLAASLLMIGLELQVAVAFQLLGASVPLVLQVVCQMIGLSGAILLVRRVFELPEIIGWPKRSLAFLGSISFSLYLVHGPIVLFVVERLELNTLIAILIAVGSSLLVAKAYFVTIETPALVLARRVRMK